MLKLCEMLKFMWNVKNNVQLEILWAHRILAEVESSFLRLCWNILYWIKFKHT